MHEPPELSIILPAYHEEENLRILLPRIKEVLQSLNCASEIWVVDTLNPLDHTKRLCMDFDVKYVPRRPDNTFGAAVRTGIAMASGRYTLFMDADGSHTPEFIAQMYKHRLENDVVIASRYIEGGYTENSPLLVLMSYVLNFTYRIVLHLNCRDVSNSFKLYRTEHLKELTLVCNNFDIIEEILFKLSRHHPGFRIKEIPFSFKRRLFGKTKRNLFFFAVSFLVTIVKLRLSTFSFFSRKR